MVPGSLEPSAFRFMVTSREPFGVSIDPFQVPFTPAARAVIATIRNRISLRMFISDFRRHDERRTVIAGEHPGRFGITRANVLFGIEVDRTAEAIADVRQVHQRSRDRAFLDGSVEIFFFTAAEDVYEICE